MQLRYIFARNHWREWAHHERWVFDLWLCFFMFGFEWIFGQFTWKYCVSGIWLHCTRHWLLVQQNKTFTRQLEESKRARYFNLLFLLIISNPPVLVMARRVGQVGWLWASIGLDRWSGPTGP
jgi:hypothetical protein